MPKLLLILLTMVLFMGGAGCSYLESRFEQKIEPRLSHVTVHKRPDLEKSNGAFNVYPAREAPGKSKVLFFPFYAHSESGADFKDGRRLSLIFWRTWLAEEVFLTMAYEDLEKWPGSRRIGELARKAGADLYVQGQITHYVSGGSQGDTALALQINIHEAESDQLIWSMEHSGRIDRPAKMDYILVKRRSWMPESPERAIVNNLAQELAAPVKKWSRGQDYQQALSQR